MGLKDIVKDSVTDIAWRGRAASSRIAWLGCVALFACAVLAPGRSAAASLADTVAQVKQSVVGVATFQGIRQPQSVLMGTGFVVGDGNHVLTNHHVIKDHLIPVDKEVLVVLIGHGQSFEHREARVVATQAVHDLALLRIGGASLPPLRLARETGMAREGQLVALTGYPIGPVFGLYPVTHRGIISAITPNKIPMAQARLLDATTIRRQRFNVYQLDLTAYPGNSGSPLYDVETGRVLGILNSTFVKETKERALTDPSGISFAIPVRFAHLILRKAGIAPTPAQP